MKTFALLLTLISAAAIRAGADQTLCFGTAENRGNKVLMEINEDHVQVLKADSQNVDISIGNRVEHLEGKLFESEKVLSGKYRYDMGFDFGGTAQLLIDEKFVDGEAESGSATIRSAGDNGLLYIRFFCKKTDR